MKKISFEINKSTPVSSRIVVIIEKSTIKPPITVTVDIAFFTVFVKVSPKAEVTASIDINPNKMM